MTEPISRMQDIPQRSDTRPEISVVVPAYYGRDVIANCLASIRRAVRGLRAEVLVVESSGDGTVALIHEQFPEVTCVVSLHRLSAGAARQRGLSAARAPLVFCVDQDCTVPDDWISRLRVHFSDGTVGAVGGAVAISDRWNLSGSAVYFLEFFRHFPTSAAPTRNRNFLVGCNSAYRTEAIQAASVPDTTLGEDVLFTHRLRASGWNVVYDAGVAVAHRNRTGWRELLRYSRAMGRASVDAHAERCLWWVTPFLRWPVLTYVTPIPIAVYILSKVLRSRWSYGATFVLLLPACLLGSVAWADAFRARAMALRAQRSHPARV